MAVRSQTASIMLTSMKNTKAYFMNFIVSLVGFPIYVATMYFLWKSIYANANITEIAFPSLVSYYMLTYITRNMISGSWIAYQMNTDINQGTLAVYLVRPLSYLKYIIAQRGSDVLFRGVLLIGAYFIMSLIMPINLVSDPLLIFLLFVSLFFAFLIFAFIYFIVGTTTFWFEHNEGIITVTKHLGYFLAGALAPLTLFPPFISAIADVLPFKYTTFFPVYLGIGQLNLQEALTGIAIQLFWVALLYILAIIFWNKGVKHFTGHGI